MNTVKSGRALGRWLRDARISLSLFTFSVAVLVSAIFYAALSIESLMSDYSTIANAHAVLGGLAATRNAIETRVNALRSYVIMGNANLLVDYRNASSDIDGSLASLRGLVSGSTVAQQRMEALQITIGEQSAVSERILRSYQRGRQDSVRQLLAEDDTKLRTLDHTRAAITAFEAKENASLSMSMTHADVTLRYAIVVGTMGLAVYFLVQCIVFARMDKESERRRGADSSLVKANAELVSSLEQLKLHNRVTQAVSQFGEILQNCRSVSEATALTLHQVVHFIPAISVEIGLFNEPRDAVEMCERTEALNSGQESPAFSISPQDCWSLRRGRVHVYTQGGGDPRCAHVQGDATRSMCIPILGQGDTLGIMSLYVQPFAEPFVHNWDIALKIAERLAPALANLKLQQTLRSQSVRDQLTGLFNRRYLDESLAREISRARRHDLPVSVLMLDIDHFKQFNDEHGHDGGDLVLKSFGELLAHSVRSEDIACRYGGEEFTLVLPGATHELALQRAEEVRSAVQRMVASTRKTGARQITTSIGVATFPAHGGSAGDIMAAADGSLYLAKNSGRNRVVGASALKPTRPRVDSKSLIEFR